ncbi:hypothetical protein BSKO_12501 [Bryopsis sp. KO-2023]|nr:hypothetical protein BSKO_12501 [Bryopsis sp. KO-2023]
MFGFGPLHGGIVCSSSVQRSWCFPLKKGGDPLKTKFKYALGAGCALGVAGTASLSLRSRGGRVRGQKDPSAFGHPARRVTDILLVLNVAMFGLQSFSGQRLLLAGAKINHLIAGGEYYRLLSAAFLHGDLFHLGFNCNALHQLGPSVEMTSGHARFVAVYLGSAIAGTAMSYFCSPQNSIGASGAIFGVAGALAMFAWRHREIMGPSADDLLMRLRDTAAINLMYGLMFRRIDNWGHFGGLLGGAALSYILGPRLVVTRNRRGEKQITDKPFFPILAHRPQR